MPGRNATWQPGQAEVAPEAARTDGPQEQGTADQQAEDLLRQADDLAKALQEGQGDDKGEEAHKKLTELQRKVDELIGKGKIRPPATTQIHQAITELAQAVQQPG